MMRNFATYSTMEEELYLCPPTAWMAVEGERQRAILERSLLPGFPAADAASLAESAALVMCYCRKEDGSQRFLTAKAVLESLSLTELAQVASLCREEEEHAV